MKNSKIPPNSVNDLEFPDWSGMKNGFERVTPEAAFQLAEEYVQIVPQATRDEILRRHKCEIEFTL